MHAGITDEWDSSICLFHAMYGGRQLPVEFRNTRPTTAFTTNQYCAPQAVGGCLPDACFLGCQTEPNCRKWMLRTMQAIGACTKLLWCCSGSASASMAYLCMSTTAAQQPRLETA